MRALGQNSQERLDRGTDLEEEYDDDFVGFGGDGLLADVGDLRGDGKLVKSIIRHGFDSGIRPQLGDEVAVHFVGTLEGGHVFDDSRKRGGPFKFHLGLGEVIKGWDEGVATMWKGERALLTIDPELAYGPQGAGWKIPPNATVQFDIELLDVEEIDFTGPDWAYEDDAEVDEERLPVGRADVGEGGSDPAGRYSWERRGAEVVVVAPLAQDVGPLQIQHSFRPRHVSVVVGGEVLLDGTPGCELESEECFWEIDYNDKGER
eukprot:CAMPEP_0183579388 /NCGR_PEP_ID=MMETSP0371-20130417/143688_1 /TAXON_ID=268820 /ORGANISM="Peridinium aciculiferum, Strain PAER-2" /LENGTH=261 /DNA_ID=CAMNT_0025789901 /DNA_START=85 /DNA_END=867 /DNA_ORIENTATION=+